MSFPIVTAKTVPCTSCGARIKINKSAENNEFGDRVYNFKCNKCGALVEYNAQFVDDVIAGRQTI